MSKSYSYEILTYIAHAQCPTKHEHLSKYLKIKVTVVINCRITQNIEYLPRWFYTATHVAWHNVSPCNMCGRIKTQHVCFMTKNLSPAICLIVHDPISLLEAGLQGNICCMTFVIQHVSLCKPPLLTTLHYCSDVQILSSITIISRMPQNVAL